MAAQASVPIDSRGSAPRGDDLVPPGHAASGQAGTAQVAGPSPEMLRFAAGMRAVVAVLCTVLLVFGRSPTTPFTAGVLVSYAAWSTWLLWSAGSGRTHVWPLLQCWIDVTWIGLLLKLAGPGADMLILVAVQPVLLASIGYGAGQGVLLAVYVALWVVLRADPAELMTSGATTALVAQSAAVLALAPAAALLARPISVLRYRLALLRQLETRLDPRRGVVGVTHALVEELRVDLASDLTGLVLPAAASGQAILCTAEDGTFPATAAVHAQIESLLAAMLPCPVTHVVKGGHRWHAGTRVHGEGHGAPSASLDEALEALCGLLEIRQLAVVPLQRYDQRHGHLLIGHRDWTARDQELRALHDASPVLVRILEQATLVDRLVHETAAHERARIGRDLHDSAIQPYLGLKYALEALSRRTAPDNPARPDIDALVGLVDGEIENLREIVSGLRNGTPTGDNALLPALRRQVRHFGELFGLETRIDSPGQLRTSRALAGAVFHMVNEALNNVRKHTPAHSVLVRLARQDGWLRLSVTDDAGTVRGRAMPDFMPRSLLERATALGGRLAVLRPDGLNTEIAITVPLDASHRP